MFNRFHEDVLQGKCREKCEVLLTATSRRPETMVSIQAVADESGGECRMVVFDISEKKQDKQAVQEPRQQDAA
jgi:hypothetical protein